MKSQISSWMKAGPSGSTPTAQDQTGPDTTNYKPMVSYWVKMKTCHICGYIKLHLLLQPVQACKWTRMMLNMFLFSMFIAAACRCLCHPHLSTPPSEWGASRELPTEQKLSRSLWASVLFSFLPSFQSWCQISARRWFGAIFHPYLGCGRVSGCEQQTLNSQQGRLKWLFFYHQV